MYRITVTDASTGKDVLDMETDMVIGAAHCDKELVTSFTYRSSDSLTAGNAAAAVLNEIDRLMVSDQSAAAFMAASRSLQLRKILEVTHK